MSDEDIDIDAVVYRRALRALSINRYIVLSASNKLVDTDFLMPGDLVLADSEGADVMDQLMLVDPRRTQVTEDENGYMDERAV
jgi:hypothetical protein